MRFASYWAFIRASLNAGVCAEPRALDLSLQQIRGIIDRNTAGHPVVDALRQEVMASDSRYEELVEDDQKFVDLEVEKLADERGISLD
jgi:hypothetical protein